MLVLWLILFWMYRRHHLADLSTLVRKPDDPRDSSQRGEIVSEAACSTAGVLGIEAQAVIASDFQKLAEGSAAVNEEPAQRRVIDVIGPQASGNLSHCIAKLMTQIQKLGIEAEAGIRWSPKRCSATSRRKPLSPACVSRKGSWSTWRAITLNIKP